MRSHTHTHTPARGAVGPRWVRELVALEEGAAQVTSKDTEAKGRTEQERVHPIWSWRRCCQWFLQKIWKGNGEFVDMAELKDNMEAERRSGTGGKASGGTKCPKLLS